jgi:hypothetical protein
MQVIIIRCIRVHEIIFSCGILQELLPIDCDVFSGGALLLGHDVNISRSLSEMPLYLVDIRREA